LKQVAGQVGDHQWMRGSSDSSTHILDKLAVVAAAAVVLGGGGYLILVKFDS
jgi:hypothetical protein